MSVDYLGFLNDIGVDVIVELLPEQDSLPVPVYGVTLKKASHAETFVIKGDPSYENPFSQEDASRALNICVKLHELGAYLSPSTASDFRDIAERLKLLLGNVHYKDFFRLANEQTPVLHKEELTLDGGAEEALGRYRR
ncbi:MAG: hypothetical protein RBR35_09665 [Salinivirgaceae bacterium]|nr:hypothetical protein [Geobacteraceae bacterium]MDY0280813.1 hypothetical protein [Salinivirgaceae bacterium]